ncbi:MAG: putative membrane protein [Desulforhopalus sp.]
MAAVVVLVAVAHREDGDMKTLAELFLTTQERATITETVHTAEKTTAGEIVPMVVSKSNDYPMASVVCSASLAIPLSLLLTIVLGPLIWIGPQNMWLFLGIFTLFFMPIYFLVQRTDKLKYYFLNQKHVEEEVSKSALAAFYSQGLYKTKDDNGILLYISVLEKKVWILADAGINNVIDQDRWDTVVEELTDGIKQKRQCEAICTAINSMGEILQNHFPYQKDDKDELHNLIIG